MVLPRGRFTLLLATCLVTFFVAGEILVRQWRYTRQIGYPSVMREMADPTVRYLFIGTSRIAAAVDADAFVESLGSDSTRAINHGQGNSTLIEHALGLRWLGESGALSGRTVFIELPGGAPDTASWQDDWYRMERPELLLSVLRLDDLPELWRSEMDRVQKVAITGRFLVRDSKLFTYSERVRNSVFEWMNRSANRLVAGREPTRGDLDLVADGEVRTDNLDLKRIREWAIENGLEVAANARRVEEWDGRVIADVIRIVRTAGGEPALVVIPVSSAEQPILGNETGRANRDSFLEATERWGVKVLDTGAKFPDADFPDLWHLARSRARQFSTELARTWLSASTQHATKYP